MKPANIHQTLDARGRPCPLPLWMTRRVLKTMPPGAVLEVLATDPGSWLDFPIWCETSRVELLYQDREGNLFRYYVQTPNP